MPIRPDLRIFYRGEAWRATRQKIRQRAGNCCEFCGTPNRQVVLRARGWWTPATLPAAMHMMGGKLFGQWIIELPWRHAGLAEPYIACFPRECCRWVEIVCTVAHLNHVAGDDRDENLAFLCAWCHLNFDSLFHRDNRAARKDRARPILAGIVQTHDDIRPADAHTAI